MSLTAGNVLDLVIEKFECIVPPRVREELEFLSQNHNSDGNLAKFILQFIGEKIKVLSTVNRNREGEIECAYLANELSDVAFIISDDTAAIKRLNEIIEKKLIFSTAIVYALYVNKEISLNQSKNIIKMMQLKRNWSDNLIFEDAKLLFGEFD